MSGIKDPWKNGKLPEKNFDPADPADQEKLRQLFSGMDEATAGKIRELLKNPEETQKILSTPAAQRLIKALGGKEHG